MKESKGGGDRRLGGRGGRKGGGRERGGRERG